MSGVIQGLAIAQAACRTMISADDHTQAELDAMGNPYGNRNPHVIHEPDEIVHTQSGAYLRGLRTIPPVGTFGAIIEGQVVNDDSKDRWIQEGTTNMRARPYMEKVVETYGEAIASVIESMIDAASVMEGAA
jgi:hypothetical protein